MKTTPLLFPVLLTTILALPAVACLPGASLDKAKLVFNAGIYRLSKGVPAEMWPELTVMENKPDANNPKLRQLVIGYKATPVMNMAALQKDDGKWALVYIQFKQWPEQLKKLMQTK